MKVSSEKLENAPAPCRYCNRPARAKGLCGTHYQRQRLQQGAVDRPLRSEGGSGSSLRDSLHEKGKRPFKAGQKVYQTSHTGERYYSEITSDKYQMMRYMDVDHPHVHIKPLDRPSTSTNTGWTPLAALHFDDDGLQKGEAKQCKWKLGERRCLRKVSADYCHSHEGHWANKVKQRESEAPVDMEKADLPPAGTQHLEAPLHNTVEGFVSAFKAIPKGTPARGKFITQHMNHGPFLAALQAHPQGKQVHQMLTQHLNSSANAGSPPPGTATQVTIRLDQDLKTRALEDAKRMGITPGEWWRRAAVNALGDEPRLKTKVKPEKCQHIFRAGPLHSSIKIGSASLGRCENDVFPGLVLCFEHASKDALAMLTRTNVSGADRG